MIEKRSSRETLGVVILDDEPWSREVVKSLGHWDELGLEIVGEADDGDAGLALIARANPALVITDMRMPGMDGTDLLRTISSEYPDVRIVVMSGYDDFAYLRQALRSKAEDYLLKPIDPDELNRTLSSCVRRITEPHDPRPVSMSTPVVFPDPEVLDRYVEHRQRVFAHLLELDASGVERTLESLRRVLADGPVAGDRDLSDRITHDFVVLLEEFMVRDGVPVDPDIFRSRRLYDPAAGDPFEAIARLYARAMAAIEERRRSREHLDLTEVRDHIEHYYRDPLTLQSVAGMFLVSKEHLSRAFRKQFGTTVQDYIVERRMEGAMSLLREGSLEIKNVGRLVGYPDVAYFYRVFKKRFGVPPGQVR